MQFTDLIEIKLTLAAAIGMLAGGADATLDVKGWEEIGLKGVLLFAVYYIGKLFLDCQRSHKAEMQAAWDAHKADAHEREVKLTTAINANTTVLNDVALLTKEQTEWYRATAKVMLQDRIKPNLP